MADSSSRRWNPTLIAMVSFQFVIGSALSIVPPVIPLFLHDLGVQEHDAVSKWAGLIIGVTPLSAAIMSPHWGRVAGRIDPRRIILLACVTAAICTGLMSVATSPWQLVLLRLCMGLFGGHIVSGMALVSAATPIAHLGWALGWFATAQMAGTLLGPLIGGSIADLFHSYRAPFVIAGAAVLLICSTLVMVPKPAPTPPHDPSEIASTKSSSRRLSLVSLAILVMLVQCAILSPQPIVSLQVRELVGMREGLATLAGFAFSVLGVSGLIAAPQAGRLADSLGTRRLLIIIVTGAALMTLAQAYASSYAAFVIERFVAGLFLAGIIPSVNALIGRSVTAAARSHAYGMTSAATFLGGFLGPVSGGYLAAWFGLSSVFLFAGVLLAMLTLWLLSSRSPL